MSDTKCIITLRWEPSPMGRGGELLYVGHVHMGRVQRGRADDHWHFYPSLLKEYDPTPDVDVPMETKEGAKAALEMFVRSRFSAWETVESIATHEAAT